MKTQFREHFAALLSSNDEQSRKEHQVKLQQVITDMKVNIDNINLDNHMRGNLLNYLKEYVTDPSPLNKMNLEKFLSQITPMILD